MTTTYLAYIPSPPQGVWHLWVIPIRAYALFIIVGIIVALILGDRRWVARGGQPGVIYDIALWAVPFGLIGGRLYHVMTDWRTYFSDDGAGLAGALRIWDGGLGIWGAVALGGVGAWIGCRQKGIPLPAFGDAIAPGIVLAQAIGRLGNYFNQELYGRPTTLPWGLEVYERRDASGALDSLNGVSTGQLVGIFHPTFLYELLWNVLIFAALIYIDRRFKIGHGRLFAMYVAGYCFGRFWIELMRSDVATHIAGIRVNSFTSTFVFIGAVVYIMVAPKGREDPASLAGKPEVEEEDEVEAFAKELTAVAATTGVVAAAKAAGEAEDEDAKVAVEDSVEDSVEDEAAEEPEGPEAAPEVHEAAVEAADDAEAVDEFAAEPAAGADEEADSEDVPAAGLGAVEGEEATEALEAAPEVHEAAVEAADEAEAVADEVAAGDEAAEAEEPEAEAEEAPEAEAEGDHEPEVEAPEADSAEPEAGLGAVEGEEASDAVAAAPEVHEAAVEAADEAEAVADEVAARDEAAEAEEAVPEAEEAPEAEEPEAGLGSVEGEEAAEAVAAAPEVHEAAVEATDEAEAVADEVASEDEEPAASEAAAEAEELAADVAEAPSEDIEAAEEFAEAGEEAEPAEAAAESEDSEPDEPDTEDAEAAVGEAEAESSEEKAAEEAEAVAEEADSAAEDEPKTGVLEEAKVDEPEPTPEPATARKTGGRLSRWLRRNR